MELNDVVLLRGALQWALMDPEGRVIKSQLIKNTVVTAGRAFVLKQLQTVNYDTTKTISHLEIGSGTIAPTTADTALGGAVTRKAISSFDTTNLAANPPSWQAQISFATNEGNTTLGEAGLFNTSSGGTMLARATFTSFVKATSNTLAISYTISA